MKFLPREPISVQYVVVSVYAQYFSTTSNTLVFYFYSIY
jgi:hypothetical protein